MIWRLARLAGIAALLTTAAVALLVHPSSKQQLWWVLLRLGIAVVALNLLVRLVLGRLHFKPQAGLEDARFASRHPGLDLARRLVAGTPHVSIPPGLGVPITVEQIAAELAQAYFSTVRGDSVRALSLLTNVLIDLPQYIERISEAIPIDEEIPQLLITTTHTYRIDPGVYGTSLPGQPPDQNDVILIPLAFVRKGTLLDGFSVTDAEGRDGVTLSYNQMRGVLAYVLRVVIDLAITRPLSPGERKIVDDTTKDLVRAVCAPGPRAKQSAQDRHRYNSYLHAVDNLPIADMEKRRIKLFCTLLADHYVIVAEANYPLGPHLTLAYCQRIPMESSSTHILNRARTRFGLRYSVLDIPLNPYAMKVDTYHMQMAAGPMQYIYDHHLEWLTSSGIVTQEDLRSDDVTPYARLHYDSADPAMHLYIRRQAPRSPAKDPNGPRPLKSVVRIREIPPGALGAAMAVSFMSAAIITFFAVTGIGGPVPSQPAGGPGSDIPALLIALPGVAALVIGSWLDLTRLRRSALTTYIGLGSSTALSLLSGLYYLLNLNRRVPGQLHFVVAHNVRIYTSVTWLLLAGLALTCWLFLTADAVAASRYYFHAVRRRIERRAFGENV